MRAGLAPPGLADGVTSALREAVVDGDEKAVRRLDVVESSVGPMYVIPPGRAVFLASPRTASNAVAEALVERLGAVMVGGHHDGPDDIEGLVIPSGAVVFTVVRNHWDAVVSWYFKVAAARRPSFARFLDTFCDRHKRYVQRGPTGDFELFGKHVRNATRVLHFERLQDDLDDLTTSLDVAPIPLRLVNPTRDRAGRDYRGLYESPDQVEQVRRMFATEIAKHGFAFGRAGWPPDHVEPD